MAVSGLGKSVFLALDCHLQNAGSPLYVLELGRQLLAPTVLEKRGVRRSHIYR